MTAEAKKRPMAERIAGLDVKSSFRDIREGIGGTSYGAFTDQDIAAALGLVKIAAGKLPVWALETYFGSSLLHEHRLRAAWAEHSETPDDLAESRIRNRVAAALAIREFAGAETPASLLLEWAVLTAQPIERLRRNANEVSAWLESHRGEGLKHFKRAAREVQIKREERERGGQK